MRDVRQRELFSKSTIGTTIAAIEANNDTSTTSTKTNRKVPADNMTISERTKVKSQKMTQNKPITTHGTDMSTVLTRSMFTCEYNNKCNY